jgi:hypothetical protein
MSDFMDFMKMIYFDTLAWKENDFFLDSVGFVCGIFVWVITLGCIYGIGLFGYRTFIDIPGKFEKATFYAERVDYHMAFTSTSMIYAGKVMVPVTTYHPAHWDAYGYILTQENQKIGDEESFSSELEGNSSVPIYWATRKVSHEITTRWDMP